VSESGISKREDILLLENMKVDAALVGEELVKAADPVAKIKELLGTA
jgi:indole-3-glycerol phosphate synthase